MVEAKHFYHEKPTTKKPEKSFSQCFSGFLFYNKVSQILNSNRNPRISW